MTTPRVAEVLAYEILGTRWEYECLKRGLNPSVATADDLLGHMSLRMTYDGGKLILPLEDERLIEALEELEAEPVIVVQDPKAFVAEVTEVAGLTKTERRVVYAIVDGSPIPDGKQYTGPLARRLNMTQAAIWMAWSRAKKKLRDNWAAE